jgi:hypothetical protein
MIDTGAAVEGISKNEALRSRLPSVFHFDPQTVSKRAEGTPSQILRRVRWGIGNETNPMQIGDTTSVPMLPNSNTETFRQSGVGGFIGQWLLLRHRVTIDRKVGKLLLQPLPLNWWKKHQRQSQR